MTDSNEPVDDFTMTDDDMSTDDPSALGGLGTQDADGTDGGDADGTDGGDADGTDGGDADGTDGGAMILDEFLPMLANDPRLNLSTDRIGLFGWSMGGYGALRLASMLGAPRVAAVAVSSPAMLTRRMFGCCGRV